MNYIIPVSDCPVPCINPIVIFLQYIKTLPSYTNPLFDPTDPTQVLNFVDDVLDLINNETFVIQDNNCDNICKPTCLQECVSYMLSGSQRDFNTLLDVFAPLSGAIPSSVLPCCLNVSGFAQPLGFNTYPYEKLNCNFNTFSCCNNFNYELLTRLALFVTEYCDPTDDIFSNVLQTNDFIFEFGTFDNNSAIPTILTELETFPGYLPYALWKAFMTNGLVVVSPTTSNDITITNLEGAFIKCGIVPN